MSLIEQAMKLMPSVGFLQGYGMTELAPTATALEPKHHSLTGPFASKLWSAGRATPIADVKIADADDREVPRGTVGQILVRGPGVMKGYWNQPELTAETLRGGWMHTGDAGYMDDDGFLYVVDRIKDMIITGGENVYSAEVENAICKHGAVAMCVSSGFRARNGASRFTPLFASSRVAKSPKATSSPTVARSWPDSNVLAVLSSVPSPCR